VPVALEWNLAVGTKTPVSFSYAATIANNRPTSLTATLNVTPYALSFAVSNTNDATAAVSYFFKNGTKILLGYEASATGSWSESNIKTNTYPLEQLNPKYDYMGNFIGYDTSKHDSVLVDKIIYTVEMNYTIMDIKLSGKSNVGTLYKKMNDISNGIYASDSAQMQAMVNELNTDIKVYVGYTSGKKIADMSAYVDKQAYTDYVFNPLTYNYDAVQRYNYNPNFRFLFPDGSKADMEVYFKKGFNNLVTEINKFQQDLATEYNFKYDPIQYDNAKKK